MIRQLLQEVLTLNKKQKNKTVAGEEYDVSREV